MIPMCVVELTDFLASLSMMFDRGRGGGGGVEVQVDATLGVPGKSAINFKEHFGGHIKETGLSINYGDRGSYKLMCDAEKNTFMCTLSLSNVILVNKYSFQSINI